MDQVIKRLDDLYGVAIAPKVTSSEEHRFKPKSLTKLSEDTALLLQGGAKGIAEKLGLHGDVSAMPILWVIDQTGVVWFALEEVFNSKTGRFVSPYYRNAETRKLVEEKGYARLGHPALIGCQPDRIGANCYLTTGPWRRNCRSIIGRGGTVVRRGVTPSIFRMPPYCLLVLT